MQKLIQPRPLLVLAAFGILISCSSPRYTYYFDRYSPKRHSEKPISIAASIIDQPVHTVIPTHYTSTPAPEILLASTSAKVFVNDHKISSDDTRIFLTKSTAEEKRGLLKSVKEVNTYKKAFPHTTKEGDNGNLALRIIGAILWVVGFLTISFSGTVGGIVGGLVIALIGIWIWYVGRKKTPQSGTKGSDTSVYTDVVYLKNGGIIRGMIIEQVPDVQIKIQTKDGNVFVYKIEEIEKMTKERPK